MRRPWHTSSLLGALALLVTTAVGAPGQERAWPFQRPPAPLAAPDVTFPPYEVRTLPNGLQVVVVLHHEQPAVSVRLLIGAGAVYDPPEKPGVASLVAALLDQGTTKRSAQEIADTIDYIGGALGTAAGSDRSFVNAVVMKDSFNLALDLVAEVARQPAFSAEEIDRQRQQLQSGLQVSLDDPDYLARVVFDRLVYGFHPYGRPEGGTQESIPTITRGDLQAFHSTYFVPNNSMLAIVGDVTAAEAFDGARRAFGDWPRRDVATPTIAEPPAPTRRVVVIDKPGSVQTEIRIGHLGIPRKHDDYMPLNLAIRILGGEGSNRLHRVLRSERGLTYSASADMNARRFTGDFVAETDTRSGATADALRLAIDEFWRIRRDRVDPRELRDAQAYMAGSFPLTIEAPDAIAAQVLNALFYGLDLKEMETFRERVNAVTVEDVQRVAMTHLKPDRLSVVLVGDASTFIDDLGRVGFDTVERIPVGELDLAAVDFRKGGTRAPQASNGREAADLIARAVEAKGGLARLQSIKTVRARATTRLFTPEGEVTAATVTHIGYPDRFRVELTMPNGRIVQVYNGGDAWVDGPAGIRAAPDRMRDEFRASVQRDLISLLLRASRGELRMQALSRAVFEGRALAGVELSDDNLDPVSLFVDPATGLVAGMQYERRGPAGREPVEEVFSDYRSVGGLLVAHKATVRSQGVMLVERTVRDFAYNVPLDSALFRKPS